jgi:antitoxin VapB
MVLADLLADLKWPICPATNTFADLLLLENTAGIGRTPGRSGFNMALYIRDQRAALLARQLAARKKTTVTQAVVTALQQALAREARPLHERINEIASEARRAGKRGSGRVMSKREIDKLWNNT